MLHMILTHYLLKIVKYAIKYPEMRTICFLSLLHGHIHVDTKGFIIDRFYPSGFKVESTKLNNS